MQLNAHIVQFRLLINCFLMDQKEYELSKVTSSFQMMNALIMSVSIIVASALLYLMNENSYITFFGIGTLVAGLVAEFSTIRYTLSYRDNLLGGNLTFGQSVSFGSRIFFLSGLILTFAAYLFFRFNPSFFFDLLNQLKDMANSAPNGKEVDELKQQIALMESQFVGMTPISLAFNLYVSYFTCGFFATIIHSLFTKRNVGGGQESEVNEEDESEDI